MAMGGKDPGSPAGVELIWVHGGINWALHDFLEFCYVSVVCKGVTKGKLGYYTNKYLQTL